MPLWSVSAVPAASGILEEMETVCETTAQQHEPKASSGVHIVGFQHRVWAGAVWRAGRRGSCNIVRTRNRRNLKKETTSNPAKNREHSTKTAYRYIRNELLSTPWPFYMACKLTVFTNTHLPIEPCCKFELSSTIVPSLVDKAAVLRSIMRLPSGLIQGWPWAGRQVVGPRPSAENSKSWRVK